MEAVVNLHIFFTHDGTLIPTLEQDGEQANGSSPTVAEETEDKEMLMLSWNLLEFSIFL